MLYFLLKVGSFTNFVADMNIHEASKTGADPVKLRSLQADSTPAAKLAKRIYRQIFDFVNAPK
jgi:hypothetical protein